jgi:uncharacterized phage protein (TIGR01671 family)
MLLHIIAKKQKNKRSYQVHSDTVSQYTGLKDKNGTKIFEGDVLPISTLVDAETGEKICLYSGGIAKTRITANMVVEHHPKNGGWKLSHYRAKYKPFWICHRDFSKVEIIGNRWDNPELLQ